MAGVVDADTHIAESESMWKLLDDETFPRRPVLASVPEDTWYGTLNAFWLIDGNIFPKPGGKGGFRLVTPSASKRESARDDITIACREITKPAARIAAMDSLGVDVQVIYPTLFLIYLTDDVELEIALCKAYNRWMAQVWSQSNNRLRWAVIPPLRSINASVEEMQRGKQFGAAGVFFRGVEGALTLGDPYFDPIYAAASELDLPICIHTGSGSRVLLNFFDLQLNSTFASSLVLPLFAFRDIVANRIPEKFPTLRFGFIEAKASWVPYLIHVLRREGKAPVPAGRTGIQRPAWKHETSVDLFRDYRIFVACEADEDIPYLLQYVGEDNLLIGSDYGHRDPANEPQLVETMRSREDLTEETTDKILSRNPTRFYGL